MDTDKQLTPNMRRDFTKIKNALAKRIAKVQKPARKHFACIVVIKMFLNILINNCNCALKGISDTDLCYDRLNPLLRCFASTGVMLDKNDKIEQMFYGPATRVAQVICGDIELSEIPDTIALFDEYASEDKEAAIQGYVLNMCHFLHKRLRCVLQAVHNKNITEEEIDNARYLMTDVLHNFEYVLLLYFGYIDDTPGFKTHEEFEKMKSEE